MTTIFAFDTATSVTACALVRDGEVLGERVTTAREVLAAADELVREAGLAPRAIEGLVVGTGPGSFTSIRIGLATARGLALALDVPVAGVSTLLAFAGGRAVIDARRGEVFTTGPTRRAAGGPRSRRRAPRRRRRDPATASSSRQRAPRCRRTTIPTTSHARACSSNAPTRSARPTTVEPTYLRAPDAVPSR